MVVKKGRAKHLIYALPGRARPIRLVDHQLRQVVALVFESQRRDMNVIPNAWLDAFGADYTPRM